MEDFEQGNVDQLFQQKAQYRSQKKLVLVVDDDPDIRDFVRATLTAYQFDVFEVSNGSDALRLAFKLNADLVLLDILMPGLNGIVTCRYLKRNISMINNQPPPVIMMTSVNEQEIVIEAIKAGADDYIVKPFTGESLVSKVREHLRSDVAYKAL